jgi:hypothetical protein
MGRCQRHARLLEQSGHATVYFKAFPFWPLQAAAVVAVAECHGSVRAIKQRGRMDWINAQC